MCDLQQSLSIFDSGTSTLHESTLQHSECVDQTPIHIATSGATCQHPRVRPGDLHISSDSMRCVSNVKGSCQVGHVADGFTHSRRKLGMPHLFCTVELFRSDLNDR